MTSVELHCTHVFTDFKPYLYYIIPVVEIMNQTELESSNTFVQSLLNSPNPNHQVGTKATTAVIFAWTAFCECEEIKPNSKTCKKLTSSYQVIIWLCTVIIQSTLKHLKVFVFFRFFLESTSAGYNGIALCVLHKRREGWGGREGYRSPMPFQHRSRQKALRIKTITTLTIIIAHTVHLL